MEFVAPIGTIILINIAAWIAPGPNMFAVMAASLTRGRRHGIATGVGLACAALIWSVLAVLGVAVLFDLFPNAVMTLKLAGAGYLAWLGFKSIKSARLQGKIETRSDAGKVALPYSFRVGFTVGITNPKAALFFGSVMTAFIPAGAPDWFLAIVVAICGLLAVFLHSITATLFSTQLAVRLFTRFRRTISYVFGAVFIALGGSIAYAAVRRVQ